MNDFYFFTILTIFSGLLTVVLSLVIKNTRDIAYIKGVVHEMHYLINKYMNNKKRNKVN